jgi:hypothetical protein
MKPRYAATLALVGWYLMVPPLSPDGKQIDATAKLSDWDAKLGFDHASACTDAYDELLKKAIHSTKLDAEQLRHSQCISTDDSRLKYQ